MDRAIYLLKRALRDILGNPVAALQVSVVPLLIVVFVGQHWLGRAVAAQEGFLFFPGRFVWWMWAVGLAGLALPLLWLAVGWHRFVILGERPWPVAPRLHIGRIVAYGWRSILVSILAGLSAFLGAIAMGFLVAIVLALAGYGDLSGTVTEWSGRLLGAFLFNYAFLFLSATLVGAACGRPTTLREAIQLGDHNTVAIFWLTLASIGMVWMLETLTGLMQARGLVLAGYELTSSWFVIIFNVGILTALVTETSNNGTPLPLPPEPSTPIIDP